MGFKINASQTRKESKTVGTFVIKHIYSSEESEAISAMFKRMYGWS